MKKMDYPVYLALFATLIGALAAFWASRNQAKESDENKVLYKQIAGKNNEIAQYAKNQEKESQEVIRLQQALISKNEELANLATIQNEKTEGIDKKTEELTRLNIQLAETQLKLAKAQEELKHFSSESLNYLTGGDSWCYAKLSYRGGNEIVVLLYHEGKYPLSALRVEINRNTEMAEAAKGSGPMVKGFIISKTFTSIFPVGPLPSSNEPYQIGTLPFKYGAHNSYSIRFSAQNGIWKQEYSITYDEHKMSKTWYQVTKGDKIILNSPNY